MAENSAISWTRHTWNPWMGCTKVSPACDGCYAEALMDKRYGKVQWGNAPRVRTGKHTWNDPFRWQRQAEKDGDRPLVFCASLADIFDNQVDPQWRADAFDVMRRTPNLVYLLLTKRPQNIIKLAEAAGGLPSNAAIGTTIEDQKRANSNVPALLEAKGKLQPLFAFVSCEPLLSHIQIAEYLPNPLWNDLPSWRGPEVDWVITGGETDQGGHAARPTHPRWFTSLRDQCAAAGVPFHHKQNGEYLPEDWFDKVRFQWQAGSDCPNVYRFPDGTACIRVGKRQSGRMLDCATHDAFPTVVTPSAVGSEPVAGYRRRLPQYAFEHYEFEQPGYENPSISDWEPLYASPVRSAPAPAPAGEDGWRTIETAPKDGSTFLAIMAKAYSPKATLCKFADGKFLSPSQGEKFVLPGWNQWWPTHWRPLPAPLALSRKPSDAQTVGDGSTSSAKDADHA